MEQADTLLNIEVMNRPPAKLPCCINICLVVINENDAISMGESEPLVGHFKNLHLRLCQTDVTGKNTVLELRKNLLMSQ